MASETGPSPSESANVRATRKSSRKYATRGSSWSSGCVTPTRLRVSSSPSRCIRAPSLRRVKTVRSARSISLATASANRRSTKAPSTRGVHVTRAPTVSWTAVVICS